jgi:pyruvate/2-oxoglutarate dehydrogenase complex dihydrolipoamide dehydrogenase (E3) component
VLVYDDHGGNQALDTAEAIVAAGCSVEVVTPERTVSPDVGGIVGSGYLAGLAEAGARLTVCRRLREVRRGTDGLVVTLGVDGSTWTEERVVDAVVAECGTDPVSDVYDGLVAGSSNGGEIDLAALLGRRAQTVVRNDRGIYQVFRIGDAVAGRNVHAAMLDAARLCHAI